MVGLLSSPPPAAPAARQHPQLPRHPSGIDAREYDFASSGLYQNHSNGMDEMRDTQDDTASDGEDEEVDDEFDGQWFFQRGSYFFLLLCSDFLCECMLWLFCLLCLQVFDYVDI
ncbi:hypothetical protein KSP39_PZI021948 [Platanthera zijinensis]|uniref:Uncharacterized protein n=1 Tax=Platanthera zijinensis TaxID=2320716 RepID=A0AAP0AXW2_9ASPA